MKPDLDKVRLRRFPFLQPQHVDEVFASRRKRAVAFAVIRSQFGHTCGPTEIILKQRPAKALRRQLAAERRTGWVLELGRLALGFGVFTLLSVRRVFRILSVTVSE